MIVSSKYTKTKYGKSLIKFLQENCTILEFIDFKDSDVFEGITAYPSIIIFRKGKVENSITQFTNISTELPVSDLLPTIEKYKQNVPQQELFNIIGSWNNNSNANTFNLFQRLEKQFPKLADLNLRPQVGIKTGFNKAFIISENLANLNDPHIKKYILGKDVKRYDLLNPETYIIFPYNNLNNKLELANEEELSIFVKSHLNKFKSELENRAIIKDGLKNGSKKWYEYQQIKLDFDYSQYIVYPDISNGVNFTLSKELPFDMTCFGIQSNSKSLLAILNSNLIKSYLENITVKARGGYLRLKSQYINNIPLPKNINSENLNDRVEMLINKRTKLLTEYKDFLSLLHYELKIPIKLSITELVELGTNQFLELTSSNESNFLQKEELLDWFRGKQTDLHNLYMDIISIEDQINKEIYNTYKLSLEEIELIEQSLSK